ncbi:MAG: diguanylate cyclase [Lachnospiraceae bacterium]|nr:diguanylate cyclase [Lachnospiraceae bacterium]
MKKLELNRTHLKLIAIFAMVIDHTAWGFVDFMSPLGQFMHIIGRLTLPIMCYFVAEGYRHTKNLKAYIFRMVNFAIITIIPFYVFFHEEYYYRQNIIFDLLLALLALATMEHVAWKKTTRILIVAGLFLVSMAIGGWVVMPIVYVFIFYYSGNFKTAAKRFTLATVVMETVLIIMIILNQQYHYSVYDWTVEERVYLIFFVIALIPLYFYNGKKGSDKIPNIFFYHFYPTHFIVLAYIKYFITSATWQDIYIHAHVISLVIGFFLLMYVLSQRPSRAQVSVTFFLTFGTMYVFGFLLEITAGDVAGAYAATKLQYLALCMVFVAVTYCNQELCHVRMPRTLYCIQAVVTVVVMYYLFTYEENHLFYTGLSINTTAGPFPRLEIEGYGPVFYGFVLYSALICALHVGIGIYSAIHGTTTQKKRLSLLLYALIAMWGAYIIKPLNITNGYEIPALFIPFTAFFITQALVRYNYLDSVTVNFSSALSRGQTGVLVMDRNHKVLYHNESMHGLFGAFKKFDDAFKIPYVEEAFRKKSSTIELDGYTYEMKVEPVLEQGHHTGDILWVYDLTEHYQAYDRVLETSNHDDLTGIYNRRWMENRMEQAIENKENGAFFMVDLDKFKHVNDTYGHQVGDMALIVLASCLKRYKSKLSENVFCAARLGGDEFCIYYRGETTREALSEFSMNLITDYDEELKQNGYDNVTSLSIGIAILNYEKPGEEVRDFGDLYRRADRALYRAKEAGRKTFRIYE